ARMCARRCSGRRRRITCSARTCPRTGTRRRSAPSTRGGTTRHGLSPRGAVRCGASAGAGTSRTTRTPSTWWRCEMAVSREPTVPGNIRQHQRDLDRLGSAPPGPMSWGPKDGHIRFYAADGKVLFQANSRGASVVSRGSLSPLTELLDNIRDLDDAQNRTLSDHREWLIGHNDQLTAHRGRLDGHDADISRIDALDQ